MYGYRLLVLDGESTETRLSSSARPSCISIGTASPGRERRPDEAPAAWANTVPVRQKTHLLSQQPPSSASRPASVPRRPSLGGYDCAPPSDTTVSDDRSRRGHGVLICIWRRRRLPSTSHPTNATGQGGRGMRNRCALCKRQCNNGWLTLAGFPSRRFRVGRLTSHVKRRNAQRTRQVRPGRPYKNPWSTFPPDLM